jgi:WD40 repeat protein
VAYSPDGRTIATVNTRDYLVRVWDVRSRALLANLSGHTDGVNGVEFAPAGSALASAGVESLVAVWNLRPDRALELICQSLAGAELDAEWRELGVDPAEAPCR